MQSSLYDFSSSLLAGKHGARADAFIAAAHAADTGPYGKLSDDQLFGLMAQICGALHGTGLPGPYDSAPPMSEVFAKAPVQPPGTKAEQDAMVQAAGIVCS